MQRRTLVNTLLLTGLGAAALPAMAHGPHDGPHRPGPDHRPGPRPPQHGPRPPLHGHRPPPPGYRPPPGPPHRPPPHMRHYNARGPEFHRGRYLPPHLRHRNYWVADYRRHYLPRPPRRHHWVQVGPDYVLIDAAGLIINVVLGR